MMNHEEDFLKAMVLDPSHDGLRKVFADWLEGRGDPRGELLRISDLLRQIDVPHREKLEERLRQLLYQKKVQPVGPFLTTSLGMTMAWIPAGSFLMGSPEDEDQVRVRLTRGFYLGISPVTQAQYLQVTGENPSSFCSARFRSAAVEGLKTDAFPVETVSWEEAQEFCKKLSEQTGERYSLPSEAQWEYACRGGTTTPYYFGKTLTTQEANFDRSLGRTSQVGGYPSNGFGLFDMHGNVWEWCQDAYQKRLPGGEDPCVEGSEGADRVLRGGCWGNVALYVRCAYRLEGGPGVRVNLLGFRFAQVQET